MVKQRGRSGRWKNTLKNIICPTCNKDFRPRASKDKYCSRECYYEMKRIRGDRVKWTKEMREELSKKYTGEGNPMHGKPSWSKGKKRPEISGENHWNYKGGWVQQGYRFISVRGETKPEHRYIMEQHLGRELDPEQEVVHHINGDRLDNRLENLKLMTRKEHMNEHREDLQGKSI